jgi:hypothetical protein
MKRLWDRTVHKLGSEVLASSYDKQTKEDFYRISSETGSPLRGLLSVPIGRVRRIATGAVADGRKDIDLHRNAGLVRREEGDHTVKQVTQPYPMQLCSVCQHFDYGAGSYPVRRLAQLLDQAFVSALQCDLCTFFAGYIRQSVPGDVLDGLMSHPDDARRPIYLRWDQNKSVYRLWLNWHNARDYPSDQWTRLIFSSYEREKRPSRNFEWFITVPEQVKSTIFEHPSWTNKSITESFRSMTAEEAACGRPDYSLISSWLEDCTIKHKCATTTDREAQNVELRLIDVHQRMVRSYRQPFPRYYALSYVWGTVSRTTPYLDSSDAEVWSLATALPMTFEDAMSITRNLGEQYLWIDVFCIDQHDPAKKSEQIQQMDVIFSQAALTIVSVSGHDSNSGLPGVSTDCEPRQLSACQTQVGLAATRAIDEEELLEASPWNKRGWCLQEEVLSRRCLFFTDHQYWLSCQQSMYISLHTGSFPLPDRASWSSQLKGSRDQGDKHASAVPTQAFCKLVDNYNRRLLSHSSDVLGAFTGVLNVFQTSAGEECLMGLPRTHLCAALCWSRNRSEIDTAFSDSNYADPSHLKPRLNWPSWSWTGWRGSVDWEQIREHCQFSFHARHYWDAATGWEKADERQQSSDFEFHPAFIDRMAAIMYDVHSSRVLLVCSLVANLPFYAEFGHPHNMPIRCRIRHSVDITKTAPWDALRKLRSFKLVQRKNWKDTALEPTVFYIRAKDLHTYKPLQDEETRTWPKATTTFEGEFSAPWTFRGEFMLLMSLRSMGPRVLQPEDLNKEVYRRRGEDHADGLHHDAMVWAMLIVRHKDGTARRAAVVRMPIAVWEQAEIREEDIILK